MTKVGAKEGPCEARARRLLAWAAAIVAFVVARPVPALAAEGCQTIVDVAVAEQGRGPDEVGQDLGRYPFALGNYLEPGEAWCSEFVAWTYEVAGHPFTGGSEGGWMLSGSTTIRSWFQDNRTFVSQTDPQWDTFVPAPGDYIRYNNSSGGHSGIVRSVSGSTLYTVEVNVSNQVRLRTITDFRSRADIDGFGVLGLNDCCLSAADCDDADPCTTDECSPDTLVCAHAPVATCADGGTPPLDAGPPPQSDGPPIQSDAASPAADGGADAPAALPDAGAPPDVPTPVGAEGGATPADARPSFDGAPAPEVLDGALPPEAPDGGAAAAGAERQWVSGCGACATSSSGPALPLLLLAALALSRRRRGRRWPGD